MDESGLTSTENPKGTPVEKKITFYMDYHPEDKSIPADIKHGYYETLNEIESMTDEIHTTQICLLSTSLWEKGYQTFVRDLDGEVYELRLGANERTPRELRMGHNLYKMLVAGGFLKPDESRYIDDNLRRYRAVHKIEVN